MMIRQDFATFTGLAVMLASALMLLAATEISAGGTVVRDHRGSSAKVPPPSKPLGPYWRLKGGGHCGKGKECGAIVRDHR